jgi:hypothetical protein
MSLWTTDVHNRLVCNELHDQQVESCCALPDRRRGHFTITILGFDLYSASSMLYRSSHLSPKTRSSLSIYRSGLPSPLESLAR